MWPPFARGTYTPSDEVLTAEWYDTNPQSGLTSTVPRGVEDPWGESYEENTTSTDSETETGSLTSVASKAESEAEADVKSKTTLDTVSDTETESLTSGEDETGVEAGKADEPDFTTGVR